MRRLSAQYIFTSAGTPLKRGIITVADDNTILSVEDTGGSLPEKSATEFYNGIITPGFINCHCHLELSHMRSHVTGGRDLADFITAVRETRESSEEEIMAAAKGADNEMFREGIAACGDISNNALTFVLKSESRITYVTFIEVFGIDSEKAEKRIGSALEVAAAAAAAGLPAHITPHSVYSVSRRLFNIIKEHISPASLTALHFLESNEERDLACRRRGRLAESYRSLGMTPDTIDTPQNHVATALSLAEKTGTLILVHNTFINREETEILASVKNIWFCLCPSSNLFITGKMPPVEDIRKASDRVVLGTDSLASNARLSILEEMKHLQNVSPEIPLEELVRWGTINGARALHLADTFGTIERGKKPGLLLIEGADLHQLKLMPRSTVRRLL